MYETNSERSSEPTTEPTADALVGSDSDTSLARPAVMPMSTKLILIGMGVIIVLLVALVLLLVLRDSSSGDEAASKSAVPETFVASGALQLIGTVSGSKEDCYGSGGYDDLHEGTQIVVRNAQGDTVAIGELAAGTTPNKFDFGGSTIVACEWPFDVEGVPAGSSAYSIEVSHRGEVAFTEDEADAIGLKLN